MHAIAATIPGSSQQHFAGTPTTLNLISQPSPLAHPASSSQGRIAPADMQPRPSCAEAPDAQPATQPWEEAVHDEHKEHQPQGAAKRRRSQSGPVIDLCQDAEVSHSGSQAQRRRRRRHTLSQGMPLLVSAVSCVTRTFTSRDALSLMCISCLPCRSISIMKAGLRKSDPP